ncbi:hypothetical protein PAEPH01_1346 [Pancytospora epiphaga]|nr:hypothetical protein PAEPH01_1346 [Pancytospora epiphaga]
MKGDLQRRLVKLAALHKAMGVDNKETLITKHKKLFKDEIKSISLIFKKVIEIQQRGSILNKDTKHSDFLTFKVIADLQNSLYTNECTKTKQAFNICPICGESISYEKLEEHIRNELLSSNDNGMIRATIDSAFGIADREAYFEAKKGRELKELIYEQFGISVSSQVLKINGKVVGNKENISGSTVNLKYKKHYLN